MQIAANTDSVIEVLSARLNFIVSLSSRNSTEKRIADLDAPKSNAVNEEESPNARRKRPYVSAPKALRQIGSVSMPIPSFATYRNRLLDRFLKTLDVPVNSYQWINFVEYTHQ